MPWGGMAASQVSRLASHSWYLHYVYEVGMCRPVALFNQVFRILTPNMRSEKRINGERTPGVEEMVPQTSSYPQSVVW